MNVATLAPLGISEHGPVGCHLTRYRKFPQRDRNTGVDFLDELVQTQTPEMHLVF